MTNRNYERNLYRSPQLRKDYFPLSHENEKYQRGLTYKASMIHLPYKDEGNYELAENRA